MFMQLKMSSVVLVTDVSSLAGSSLGALFVDLKSSIWILIISHDKDKSLELHMKMFCVCVVLMLPCIR